MIRGFIKRTFPCYIFVARLLGGKRGLADVDFGGGDKGVDSSSLKSQDGETEKYETRSLAGDANTCSLNHFWKISGAMVTTDGGAFWSTSHSQTGGRLLSP